MDNSTKKFYEKSSADAQTLISNVPDVLNNARTSFSSWRLLSLKERISYIKHLRETILKHKDDLIDVISKENGKPRFEALCHDILPVIDLISYYIGHSHKILKNEKLNLRYFKHKTSYLQFKPLGVVLIISPWNFPLSIPLGQIIVALITGNSVILKPSEISSRVGGFIQLICDEAELPTNLVQVVFGDGALGESLINHKPDKIFFTGGTQTGRRIMELASKHLIPVNLELGGKNPLIVLSDAKIDYATSAVLWGAFCNSGQACSSVDRVIVHESIAQEFLSLLKSKISKLRQGSSDASDIDLGTITTEKQKNIYKKHIEEARTNGADIFGGKFNPNETALEPTIVFGDGIESLSVFREETFGPIISVTTFKSLDEAIAKANDSDYGLVASVITQDVPLGEQVAKKLLAGTVMINEVTYTFGLPETPWGGFKFSGFGRTHSARGLYEFVNTIHIHKPKRFLISTKRREALSTCRKS